MNASAQSLATASPGAFPEGSRIAFVDFDRVASASTVGKVISEVAQARNVWAVFRVEPASVFWYHKALDISDDVVAKLDGAAASKPPAAQVPRP